MHHCAVLEMMACSYAVPGGSADLAIHPPEKCDCINIDAPGRKSNPRTALFLSQPI